MTAHSKPDSVRPEPNHLWVALAQSYRALSLLVERSVAQSGLSLTDFMLLEALLHKGPLTISEIQGSVLLATGSMTAAVDRVESKGLIVRRPVDNDRRARRLELTPEGRTMIEAAFTEHNSELTDWFSVLSPSQRAEAFSALRSLTRHAETLLAQGKPG